MTDDLKQRLEKLGDRAGGEPSLAGLHAVRDRKARRQHLGAGLLAVVVAVAGTVTAMTAFRDSVDDPTVPSEAAWTPPEVLTVWPENPVRGESPEAVQAAVDAGDESLAWRLDPREVAERFVRMVLAWEDPIVSDYDGPAPPEGIRYLVVLPRCSDGALCDPPGALHAEVRQPVRVGDGGIWSVASVSSEPLGIDVGSTDLTTALAFGSVVDLTVNVPDDRSAHAGIVVANGCEQAFELEKSIPPRTSLAVPAAENLDPSCGRIGGGYVFIYAMDDTTEPSGDPLVEPAAIEYPWLTIVPVYVEMQPGDAAEPTEEPAPQVLEISCYGEPSTVVGSSVAAQPDGVHVRVSPTDYAEVMFDQELFRRIEGGSGEFVLDLQPGEHGVQCILPGARQVWDPETFEVVDPNGYWVDPELDCEPQGGTDFDAGPITVEGDPSDELLASGESLIRGIAKLDEPGAFLFGGYPESRGSRWVVLISPDGYVVARTEFTQSGQDWYPDHIDTCEGMIIF